MTLEANMPHAATGFGTRAIHVGQEPDPTTGAVIPPLSLSTTFKQEAAGQFKIYDYSRCGNPTRDGFEAAVASLEGGRHCVAFSSGCAVTSTLATMLGTGAHVIAVNDVYGGTFRFFTKIANTLGITVSFVDMTKPETVRDAWQPNTKLVWLETPTNPTLRLVDIAAVSKIAHEQSADATVVVDNTFLSPYFQTPLALGADVVVHSVTKYLNGHSDCILGVAVTNSDALHGKMRFLQGSVGAIPSPFDCYLAHRGLKTLHLRMQQHAQSALAVAQALERHPDVVRVVYPGLPSHPQHELAKRQTRGFGGMVSFELRGTLANANAFLAALKIFTLAESLGGVESLAELPAVMTHASLTPEARRAVGITDTFIRLSVGIEETSDLLGDLAQALSASQRI